MPADVLRDRARVWIEASEALPWAVYNASLAMVPQACEVAGYIMELFEGKRLSSLSISKQTVTSALQARCVGATTLFRATAFEILRQLPDCIVVQLTATALQSHHSASATLALLKRMAQKRPVLLLDDQLGPDTMAELLAADEHAGFQLVYLRVVCRETQDCKIPVRVTVLPNALASFCNALAHPTLGHSLRVFAECWKSSASYLTFCCWCSQRCLTSP